MNRKTVEEVRSIRDALIPEIELWNKRIGEINFTKGHHVYKERIQQVRGLIRMLDDLIKVEIKISGKVISVKEALSRSKALLFYCLAFSKELYFAKDEDEFTYSELLQRMYAYSVVNNSTLSDIGGKYKSLGHGGYCDVYDLAKFLKLISTKALSYIVEFSDNPINK